jgi:phospholipid/cholesterol/gamma-HCH transport system substrate-binding protein
VRRARVRLNLIFFVLLFAVLLFEATRAVITVGEITHPYQLSAAFTDANGLVVHDEVDYLGVPYGEVSSVSRDPADGGAVVRLAMIKGRFIPEGSVAHLDLKSTIGEQYINFQPPAGYTGNHGPYYQTGFKIPAHKDDAHPEFGYTTTPVQFSELLQSATGLLKSIPADQLQSLVANLSVALAGTSDSLRSLIQSGDRLSGALVTRTGAIDQLLANSTKLVHTVTEHRGSLDQSLVDLTQVAATLQSIQPTTNHLLDTANPLFLSVANLVAAAQGNLDCTLKGLNPVLDLTSTPRKLKELSTLLDVGPKAFAGINDSVDFDSGPSGTGLKGAWLRVGLTLNSNNPAVLYNPVHTFPAPAAIPSCTSALRPVAADYRPTNISARFTLLSGDLPGPAADAVTGVCVVLFALAVAARGRMPRSAP